MSIWQNYILICTFAGVALGVYGLLALIDPYWFRVRSRIKEMQPTGPAAGLAEPPARDRSLFAWWTVIGDKLGNAEADKSTLLRRLSRAGFYHPLAPSRVLNARMACTIVPPVVLSSVGALGLLSVNAALLSGCVLGGFGSLAPGLWLDRVASRRQMALRNSLPDFLDLMIVCLEGGLSLQETIRRVSEELRLAHPALSEEMRIVQRDIELGATVDQALKRFALRADYDGVRTLSTFIRETQRFGTNITEALRSHADGLRAQREQAAEEAAQKAAVKILLPTILLIFPAVFIVLVGPAAVQIYTSFGQE